MPENQEPNPRPRLHFGLFCHHHQVDQQGLNSYIGVFDSVNAKAIAHGPLSPGDRVPVIQLDPFFYCVLLEKTPDEHVVSLRITNTDGQDVAAMPGRHVRFSANSRLNSNWRITGLPIAREGTRLLTFIPMVDGDPAGETVLTVNYTIKLGGTR